MSTNHENPNHKTKTKTQKDRRAWIEKMFAAKAAQNGGMVRRSKSSVEKNASLEELKAAVEARRFKLIEVASQYVVICITSPMTIVVQ